jgi:hypothetical protein
VATVALRWNPSPDTNAVGYFLLYGTTSGTYTNQVDVGNTHNATVTGLAADAVYYFSVVAYDSTGDESPPSNEIAYTVPAGSPTGVGPPLGIGFGGGTAGAILRLSFPGSAGSTYDLQASQDLQQWHTLWTTNCASNGLILFRVTDMANYPSRFYRLWQR